MLTCLTKLNPGRAKIAQAAAGRRSSKTASRQRRGRRVNNRKSFSFSSEPFAGVRITHRHQKEAPSPADIRQRGGHLRKVPKHKVAALQPAARGARVARPGA